jgi:hypothetical protein
VPKALTLRGIDYQRSVQEINQFYWDQVMLVDLVNLVGQLVGWLVGR